MASREELYQALRNADAAGDKAGAQKLATYIQTMPAEPSAPAQPESDYRSQAQAASNARLASRGTENLPAAPPTFKQDMLVLNNAINKGIAGGIDSTVNAPVNVLNLGKALVGGVGHEYLGLPEKYMPELTPTPDVARNAMTKVGFINQAAEPTAPYQRVLDTGGQFMGGAVVNPANSGRQVAANIAKAGVSGLTAGAVKEATDNDALSFLAGALGPSGAVKAGKAVGGTLRALIDPLHPTGQDRIAQGVINKFAGDGPRAVNAQEIVPGSQPTLAEATGNPQLAGLQRSVRDTNPNRFVDRERQNAEARNTAFDSMAKDRGAIDAAINAREGNTEPLYTRAFTAEKMRQNIARDDQSARSPFVGVGLSGEKQDLATQGLRELSKRPMFRQATEDARKLAANKGVQLDDPLQSLEGLHYTKLALDDMLNPAAKTALGRNASSAVMDMRDKLTEELALVSPLYGAARQRFAEMSKPINEMEALQGLRLTDARGDTTLAKVQNAIRSIETQRAAPGINNAKAIGTENLASLRAIRDDLLRQANTQAGRSAGSNTVQNLATQNILANALPGKLGEMAIPNNILGQLGRLVYSGPNENIRNRLTDLLLDPSQAKLSPQAPARRGPNPNAALQAVTQARILAQQPNRLTELLGEQ